MDYPLNLHFARAWWYTLRDTERRREVKEGKTLNYPQRLFSLLTDWTRREHIYILNWSLSSRSLPAVNGTIMHAWIRVTNTEKCYMGYHRQWETDCTVLTRRVGLCRQRCCCMLYREKKTVQICFALFNVILQQSHRRKDEDGWRDVMPLNYLTDKSASKQRRHAFDLQKSWTRRSHSKAAPKQHFIGYLSKKTHRLTHTQVIARGSKNVEMAKMKYLLFARAVTVTGEIPF